jgi:hypothetical protein
MKDVPSLVEKYVKSLTNNKKKENLQEYISQKILNQFLNLFCE